MANRTDPSIHSLSGSDPQNCLEYITRQRIYDCRYWKEICFGLTVLDVFDKAATTLHCIGSLPYTTFISLTLKLLQLNVEHEIIYETFLPSSSSLSLQQSQRLQQLNAPSQQSKSHDFKYATALGALYIRLTSRPVEIYESLEPLYSDYRKLRVYHQQVSLTSSSNNNNNPFTIWTMDEYIHQLLTSVTVFGITLPRLPSRKSLQDAGYLPEGPRPTALQGLLHQFRTSSPHFLGDTNNNDSNDNDSTTFYESVLRCLKHKALVEKYPAAITAWNKRHERIHSGISNNNLNHHDVMLVNPNERILQPMVEEDRKKTTMKKYEENEVVVDQTEKRHRQDMSYETDNPETNMMEEVVNRDATSIQKTKKKQKKESQKHNKNKKEKSNTKEKAYSNLFKTSSNKSSTTLNGNNMHSTAVTDFVSANESTNNNENTVVDGSVEYWNEQRAKLGLKELQKG